MQGGFTVIEILVVMGLIAVLAAIVLVALNPARHFAQARNTQRTSNIAALLNAIGQNMAENRGVFTCPAGPIPTAVTTISNASYNIVDCLTPNYISALPFDPSANGAHFTSNADYNTEYRIVRDEATQRITIIAPGAELGATISVSR